MYRLNISLFSLPLSIISLVSATCTDFIPTDYRIVDYTPNERLWTAIPVTSFHCKTDNPKSCSFPQQDWTVSIEPKILMNYTTPLTLSRSDSDSIFALAGATLYNTSRPLPHEDVKVGRRTVTGYSLAFKRDTGRVTTRDLPPAEQHVLGVRKGHHGTLLWTPIMGAIEGTIYDCEDTSLDGQVVQIVAPLSKKGDLVGKWSAKITARESAPSAGSSMAKTKGTKNTNGVGRMRAGWNMVVWMTGFLELVFLML
ncbi:hypothetical protein GLAREA_11801 [Glarea lozoyensis ATCC 20868]|uniref:Uncharacterized protein n=1 Tax=Glarea lozoyensis (strain ATCC 20868 / MF5171) TaxID=1116229 RepID=S3CH77_GLAL2|nr:uncharacterized protein GLAREA_11801 [Glarea lozoyensis ATCC 20868]EPE25220.1 hypothetical protein GLAREA_11801 [Glarea lozoyensis ATCC 20868]